MTFMEAYYQGWNVVDVEEELGGYVMTLSHKITTDNAATVFVPKDNVTLWADHASDQDLEDSIKKMMA